MLRNHHLAKSSSDAGWAAFLSLLSSKAACAGREVVAVNPAFTSQICAGGGGVVAKGLSVRWHHCPGCGTSLQRDHNAAKNIERRAGSALGGGVALAASQNREPAALSGARRVSSSVSGPARCYNGRMNQRATSEQAAHRAPPGKVAVITGASRGIGRAAATLFAAEGAAVVLAARDEAALASNVAAITAAGGRALAVVTDVAA